MERGTGPHASGERVGLPGKRRIIGIEPRRQRQEQLVGQTILRQQLPRGKGLGDPNPYDAEKGEFVGSVRRDPAVHGD